MEELEKYTKKISASETLSEEELERFFTLLNRGCAELKEKNPSSYLVLLKKITEILKNINDTTQKLLV